MGNNEAFCYSRLLHSCCSSYWRHGLLRRLQQRHHSIHPSTSCHLLAPRAGSPCCSGAGRGGGGCGGNRPQRPDGTATTGPAPLAPAGAGGVGCNGSTGPGCRRPRKQPLRQTRIAQARQQPELRAEWVPVERSLPLYELCNRSAAPVALAGAGGGGSCGGNRPPLPAAGAPARKAAGGPGTPRPPPRPAALAAGQLRLLQLAWAASESAVHLFCQTPPALPPAPRPGPRRLQAARATAAARLLLQRGLAGAARREAAKAPPIHSRKSKPLLCAAWAC